MPNTDQNPKPVSREADKQRLAQIALRCGMMPKDLADRILQDIDQLERKVEGLGDVIIQQGADLLNEQETTTRLREELRGMEARALEAEDDCRLDPSERSHIRARLAELRNQTPSPGPMGSNQDHDTKNEYR